MPLQVAAELVRTPVTTVGLLARAVTADAGLDTSRRTERSAFVDALLVLEKIAPSSRPGAKPPLSRAG